MEDIGYIAVSTLCIVTGYFVGRYNRKLPRNKVLIDIDTFEYLHERDNELWEIEKAERADNGSSTFVIKHKVRPLAPTEPSKS